MTIQSKAEACRAKLADVRERHRKQKATDDVDECAHDWQIWPCDASRLLDYAEARLKRAIKAFEILHQHTEQHFNCPTCLGRNAAESEVDDLAKFLGVSE